jgi:hypothetical protein
MNLRFSTAFVALGCALLASCYPYDESHRNMPAHKTLQKTVTSAEQQKVQEQRDRLKEEENLKKKTALKENTPSGTEPGETTANTGGTPKPPAEEKRAEIAVASKVPGRDGYVFSPFNNKLIDVRNIPSGTLVADPTYPESAKKHFRVP